VLEAQTWIRANGPEHVRDTKLISRGELDQIRRIWVVDKREVEDWIPAIYAETTGCPYPGGAIDEALVFDRAPLALLRERLRRRSRLRVAAQHAGS
jgi:DNA sulfur modification protein DndC